MSPEQEKQIAGKIERVFYRDETMAINTHFEIGKHLHIDRYYYAKEYFQKIGNCKEMAEHLANRIFSTLKEKCAEITFITYGDYSAPLINETILNLCAITGVENPLLNYAIVDNSKNELSFHFEPLIVHNNIVILLPITCTFSTGFRIKNFLQQTGFNKKFRSKKISEKMFTCFLIHDDSITNHLRSTYYSFVQNEQNNLPAFSIYRAFQCEKLEHKKIIFSEFLHNFPIEGHFLVPLESKWFSPEKCELCFREHDNDYENEYSLFPTRINHDTPDMIFGLPRFVSSRGNFYTQNIQRVKLYEAHLFGHLQSFKNSILHYIKSDIFYEQNRIKILVYFRNAVLSLLSREKINNWLIITPKHNRISQFLQEFIQLDEFKAVEITILILDTNHDYFENYKFELQNYPSEMKFIYFDYVMSGAEMYKKIAEILASIDRLFDKVLVTIERTTEDSKIDILRHLNGEDTRFYSFLKLHVPLMSATKIGNPIQAKLGFLNELRIDSHLDGLKMYVGNEIERNAPKSKNEVEQSVDKFTPIEKWQHFLKLKVSHFIVEWLRRHKDATYYDAQTRISNFSRYSLDTMIKDFKERPKWFYPEGESSTQVTKFELETTIEDLVVKILTRPPFKFYHGIYQVVFEFVNKKLAAILNQLSSNLANEDVKRLKFYIRRSVELNSNFILSSPFIRKLRSIFISTASPHLLSIKYFLLRAYKELIYKNSMRSIRLEKILNSKEFWPIPLLGDGIDLSIAMKDEFYKLKRIVKAENIHLLNELKNHFIKNLRSEQTIVAIVLKLRDKTSPKILATILDDLYSRLNKHKYLHIPALRRLQIFALQMPGFDIQDVPEIRTITAGIKDYEPTDAEIEEFINNNYLSGPQIAKEPILRLTKEFLNYSRMRKGSGNPTKLVSAMLDTVYQLETKKRSRKDFIPNVKSILRKACSIIDEDAQFAFFIEFKEPMDHELNHVYTVLSNTKDDDFNQPLLHPEGFIYKMLYGLYDDNSEDANIQTFIALVKDGKGKICSFQDEYFRLYRRDENSIFEPVSSTQILRDCEKEGYGLKMFNESKIILLFRLSEITFEVKGSTFVDHGQAVLAVCLSNAAFLKKENFSEVKAMTEFINVERVRLLLLIKEQLLDYLRKQFENDAFIEVFKTQKMLMLQRKLRHGIKDYINCLTKYTGNITTSTAELNRFLQHQAQFVEDLTTIGKAYLDQAGQISDEDAKRILGRTKDYVKQLKAYEPNLQKIFEFRKNAYLINVVANAVLGQIKPLGLLLLDEAEIPVNEMDFREAMGYILGDSYLGGQSFEHFDIEVSSFPKYMIKALYNTIIPELVINMKKHHPLTGQVVLKIEITATSLKLTNRTNQKMKDPTGEIDKVFGGVDMCKDILKSLNLEDRLYYTLTAEGFLVTHLSWNKIAS